jgi:heat-inducible transcriptional repressor
MVLRPQLKRSGIKRIQLVKLTERKAILLLVTDAGLVNDSVISVPEGITISDIEMLSNLLTDKLSGKTLEQAEAELSACLRENVCVNGTFITDIMNAIDLSVEPQGEKGIVVGGAQNIIDFPDYMSVEKTKSFLALLETKDLLYDMMKKASSFEFSVTIGQENEAEELHDMSVVTATYKIGGKTLGSFGVIGPTRMDYSKIVSILAHVSSSLNSILSNFLETDDN